MSSYSLCFKATSIHMHTHVCAHLCNHVCKHARTIVCARVCKHAAVCTHAAVRAHAVVRTTCSVHTPWCWNLGARTVGRVGGRQLFVGAVLHAPLGTSSAARRALDLYRIHHWRGWAVWRVVSGFVSFVCAARLFLFRGWRQTVFSLVCGVRFSCLPCEASGLVLSCAASVFVFRSCVASGVRRFVSPM